MPGVRREVPRMTFACDSGCVMFIAFMGMMSVMCISVALARIFGREAEG